MLLSIRRLSVGGSEWQNLGITSFFHTVDYPSLLSLESSFIQNHILYSGLSYYDRDKYIGKSQVDKVCILKNFKLRRKEV
jgi:hypothetical protein